MKEEKSLMKRRLMKEDQTGDLLYIYLDFLD